MNIQINTFLNNVKSEVKYKRFLFPGGEIGIQIEDIASINNTDRPIEITARIQDSNDLFALALIRDAILRIKKIKIDLVLPYIPYGRQDKAHNPGESFSLKVFADYINSLNFDSVTSFDCHSEVTNAVFNNFKEIDRLEILGKYGTGGALSTLLSSQKVLLVSPDVGANKKIAKIAGFFNYKSFIRADKLRELQTGKIIETIVYCDDLKGQDILVADDICEKGGTFIALAKELKKKNSGKIILYVTHGIFSGENTYQNLFDSGIDEIYTTNSYHEIVYPYPLDKIHIIKLD